MLDAWGDAPDICVMPRSCSGFTLRRSSDFHLRLLAVIFAFAWVCSAVARPDFVVFLTDDLGQLDSTPYGRQGIRTPNMQRLADAGMTFTRAYVASPSCAPSRAALLTGLMPARNGAEANHSKPRTELKKWPAHFKELGYEVVAFGKVSHYKHTADYGFDHFSDDGFHEHVAITNAIAWLKARPRAGAKPLCLMIGSNWPHVPWPEETSAYDPAKLPLPAGSIDTPATRAWRGNTPLLSPAPTLTSASCSTRCRRRCRRRPASSFPLTTARSGRSANGTSTSPASPCRSSYHGPAW